MRKDTMVGGFGKKMEKLILESQNQLLPYTILRKNF